MKKLLLFINIFGSITSAVIAQQMSWGKIIINHQQTGCTGSYLSNFSVDKNDNIYFNGNYSKTQSDYIPFIGKVNQQATTEWVKCDSTPGVSFNVNWTSNNNRLFSGSYQYIKSFDLYGNLTGQTNQGFEDIREYNSSIYGISSQGITRIDSLGNVVWTKTGQLPVPNLISVADPGFMYVKYGDGSVSPSHVMRMDINGNIIWNIEMPLGYVKNICADENGNCYVLQYPGDKDWICKISSTGNTEWTEPLKYGSAVVIHYSTSKQCLYAGENNADRSALLTMYSITDGSFLSELNVSPGLKELPFEVSPDYYNIFKIIDKGNSVYITGSGIRETQGQGYLARIDFNVTGIEKNKTGACSTFDIFPNPNSGTFRLSFNQGDCDDTYLKIRDAQGKIIFNESIYSPSGYSEKEINLGSLTKGIYHAEIISGTKVNYSKKFVID